MSHQIRDLRCTVCSAVTLAVACSYREYPNCATCGGSTAITWAGGKAPGTDVFGCSTYSDATGEWHTSQRGKIKAMRDLGYEEAGDKVGGARADHTLKRSTFSFPDQGSRRTVSEGA